MSEYLSTLVRVYEAERLAYEKILQAVADERRALLDRQPLSEILPLLKSKQELIRQIEVLDRSISDEKRQFQNRDRRLDAQQSLALNELIESLKGLIEQILALEKENDDIILSHGAAHTRPALVSAEDCR